MAEENGGNEFKETEKQQPKQDYVNLKIKCNKDGKERFFKVKRNCRLRKVLIGFCQHAKMDYRSTRFVIDQRVFSHDKTPNQLGLDDSDQIDALIDGNGA